MTDESTEGPAAIDILDREPEPSDETATTDSVAGNSAAEQVPFWQRPNVERYVVPLAMPIVVVLGLVIYVLNLSRVFLSARGHIAVVLGSVITVAILVGATVLSNSGQLRSPSIALMTAGFMLVVVSAGWLVLGHSQEHNASKAKLTANGPHRGAFTIVAQPGGGALAFSPASLTVQTGIYLVTLTDGVNGEHTLSFDNTTDTQWTDLVVNTNGQSVQSRIFFGAPGDYTFYCAVPTHRQAGMQGVVHVTGTPITLAQAEASNSPSSGAAPGAGTPTTTKK